MVWRLDGLLRATRNHPHHHPSFQKTLINCCTLYPPFHFPHPLSFTFVHYAYTPTTMGRAPPAQRAGIAEAPIEVSTWLGSRSVDCGAWMGVREWVGYRKTCREVVIGFARCIISCCILIVFFIGWCMFDSYAGSRCVAPPSYQDSPTLLRSRTKDLPLSCRLISARECTDRQRMAPKTLVPVP